MSLENARMGAFFLLVLKSLRSDTALFQLASVEAFVAQFNQVKEENTAEENNKLSVILSAIAQRQGKSRFCSRLRGSALMVAQYRWTNSQRITNTVQ